MIAADMKGNGTWLDLLRIHDCLMKIQMSSSNRKGLRMMTKYDGISILTSLLLFVRSHETSNPNKNAVLSNLIQRIATC